MIDLDNLLDDLHSEIKNHTGIPQLLLGEEDIPENLLELPRGKMQFTIKYNPQARQSFIRKEEIIPSEEEGFEKDFEYTYIMHPSATLSINFYGKDVTEYISKAREWFMINQYGRRFFESRKNSVIQEVTTTSNRKTFLETEYEDRQGFDVIIGFVDKVVVTEKTIEKVEFTINNSETYNVDV